MNTDLAKFQIGKSKMNQVKGGATSTFICMCHTSGGQLAFPVSAESLEILNAKMKTECKDVGYSCNEIS